MIFLYSHLGALPHRIDFEIPVYHKVLHQLHSMENIQLFHHQIQGHIAGIILHQCPNPDFQSVQTGSADDYIAQL